MQFPTSYLEAKKPFRACLLFIKLFYLCTFFFEKVQSVTTVVDEDNSEKNEIEESQTTAKTETEALSDE